MVRYSLEQIRSKIQEFLSLCGSQVYNRATVIPACFFCHLLQGKKNNISLMKQGVYFYVRIIVILGIEMTGISASSWSCHSDPTIPSIQILKYLHSTCCYQTTLHTAYLSGSLHDKHIVCELVACDSQ